MKAKLTHRSQVSNKHIQKLPENLEGNLLYAYKKLPESNKNSNAQAMDAACEVNIYIHELMHRTQK